MQQNTLMGNKDDLCLIRNAMMEENAFYMVFLSAYVSRSEDPHSREALCLVWVVV